jgi:hypothetical protein
MTWPTPSKESAAAHMMHGSIVTYSWHLQQQPSTTTAMEAVAFHSNTSCFAGMTNSDHRQDTCYNGPIPHEHPAVPLCCHKKVAPPAVPAASGGSCSLLMTNRLSQVRCAML